MQSLYGLAAKLSPVPRLRAGFQRRACACARDFWALNNVSFEVRKGETVGIVGRNGSGKSTLLQIICGTLAQSAGEVEVRGRIAALLELGSGFNPEYTGRENVFLNGQLLGLSRQEVHDRFADIVHFADIGDFIDQPVKTYSSGMFVRLAFAVAVNVEPDILVVDEALAVGDIQFQLKCIDKMEEIRARGTTVLFVSHGLEQVRRFCQRAIWLDRSHLRMVGDANHVADAYRDEMLSAAAQDHEEAVAAHAVAVSTDLVLPAVIDSVTVDRTEMAPFDDLTVRITYTVTDKVVPKLLAGVAIKNAQGVYIFGPNTHLDKVEIGNSPGKHVLEYHIPKLPLLTGTYIVDVGIFSDAGLVCLDYKSAAAKIKILASYFSEGLVYIDHEWRRIVDV
ncbi:ABC transporter ATP-binding protein [Cupriavidus necator]